jgi:hypothetical protein
MEMKKNYRFSFALDVDKGKIAKENVKQTNEKNELKNNDDLN